MKPPPPPTLKKEAHNLKRKRLPIYTEKKFLHKKYSSILTPPPLRAPLDSIHFLILKITLTFKFRKELGRTYKHPMDFTERDVVPQGHALPSQRFPPTYNTPGTIGKNGPQKTFCKEGD